MTIRLEAIKQRYELVEQLVSNVRILFPRIDGYLNGALKKKSPFAYDILDTLRRWDLATVASVWGKARVNRRDVSADEWKKMLRALYGPAQKLSGISAGDHLGPALEMVLRLGNPEETFADSPKFSRIINRLCGLYNRIRHELSADIEKRGLTFDSSATPSISASSIPAGLTIPSSSIGRTIGDYPQLADDVKLSLALLKKIFPDSAWDRCQTFPEFAGRPGLELLDRENPLMQIIALADIMTDLFDAWKNIQLITTEANPADAPLRVLYKTIQEWPVAIDTFFEKRYINPLCELKRYYQQSAPFRHPPERERLVRELTATAKINVLPHLGGIQELPACDSGMTNPDNGPCLWELAEKLYNGLEYLAAGSGDAPDGQGPYDAHVKNAAAPWRFTRDTALARNLSQSIRAKLQTNETVIIITGQLVLALHYLINDRNSWAYRANPRKLFRSIDAAGIIPAALT